MQKFIKYEDVLEFLKWQFDEEFADQQINLFQTYEMEVKGETDETI